jgi:hypothetical protein
VPEENVKEATAVLVELARMGLPGGAESQWTDESERWAELLVSVLHRGAGANRNLARRAVGILGELGALEPGGLSSADADRRQFMQRVLIQTGFEVKASSRCVDLMVRTAAVVQDTWKGYIQRFLREAGGRMAEELAAKLEPIGLKAEQAQGAAVMWLQIVCRMPLLSPENPTFSEFCQDFAISEAQLVEIADRSGLNVAALGELLQPPAEIEEKEKKTSSKRRAGPTARAVV